MAAFAPSEFRNLIKANNLAAIKQLKIQISNAIPVNARDKVTPLQLACESNAVDVALYLLQKGADVMDFQPMHGMTTLEWVEKNGSLAIKNIMPGTSAADRMVPHIRSGNVNDVKAFMEKEKIDGFQLLPTGKNLLETACEFGSFEIAFYLADIPMDLTRINFQGETILLSILQPPALISMAIWVEKLALKLIEKGCPLHTRDRRKKSAIFKAAQMKNLNIVKSLLEHGADPLDEDDTSNTAIHLASGWSWDALKMMLDAAAQLPVHIANETKGIKMIDKIQMDGNTCLHLAVIKSQIEVVRGLCLRKASMSILNKAGASPFHLACVLANTEIINTFIGFHADPNFPDAGQRTALHLTSWKGTLEQVQLLMAKNANPNLIDCQGKFPLHFAAEQGKVDIVKYFVDVWGASPDVLDLDGNTALSIACEAEPRNLHLILSLLQVGSNPNIIPFNNNTPLMAISKLHHASLTGATAAYLLTAYGANPSMVPPGRPNHESPICTVLLRNSITWSSLFFMNRVGKKSYKISAKMLHETLTSGTLHDIGPLTLFAYWGDYLPANNQILKKELISYRLSCMASKMYLRWARILLFAKYQGPLKRSAVVAFLTTLLNISNLPQTFKNSLATFAKQRNTLQRPEDAIDVLIPPVSTTIPLLVEGRKKLKGGLLTAAKSVVGPYLQSALPSKPTDWTNYERWEDTKTRTNADSEPF